VIHVGVPVMASIKPFAIALSASAIHLTLKRHWPILWTLALCGSLGWFYRSISG
jgi:hypothetical protein